MIGDTATEVPENLTKTIRQEFIAKKSQQMGRPYRPGPRNDKSEVWLKAATNCIKLNFDPPGFVEMVFAQNTTHGGPYPTQMGGTKIFEWAKTYRARYGDGIAEGHDVSDQELESEIREISRYINLRKKEGFAAVSAIRDTLMPFSAHVRILMSPDPVTVKQFGDQAKLEMECYPALRVSLEKKGMDVQAILSR